MNTIKPEDLRIGNFITDWSGRPINVTGILQTYLTAKAEHSTIKISYDLVQPIPLTEEVLVKCGFSVRESSTCRQYYIGNNPITHDWLFDLTWLEQPELINAPNAPFYRNGNHTIYHLHHLQNLYYALTGEELIYKP